MNYSAFQNAVVEKMRLFMGKEYDVTIREVRKNNGVLLKGLVISGKESDISPTIYLESFYEAYLQGMPIQDLVAQIYKIYDENHLEGRFNFSFFEDYEKVRPRIFEKVINFEQNKDFLSNIPHKRFLDLAVVCYCVYMNDLMGKGSIQIDRSFISEWGITEEQLFRDAADNTACKLGVDVRDMQDMLFDMMLEHKDIDSVEEEEKIREELTTGEAIAPMYVMTLKGCYFGAACICHEEWMEDFYKKVKMGFYILPSSIHELILIPMEGAGSAKRLQEMVKDVNESSVSPEERLSDNVYYYNPETQRVELT